MHFRCALSAACMALASAKRRLPPAGLPSATMGSLLPAAAGCSSADADGFGSGLPAAGCSGPLAAAGCFGSGPPVADCPCDKLPLRLGSHLCRFGDSRFSANLPPLALGVLLRPPPGAPLWIPLLSLLTLHRLVELPLRLRPRPPPSDGGDGKSSGRRLSADEPSEQQLVDTSDCASEVFRASGESSSAAPPSLCERPVKAFSQRKRWSEGCSSCGSDCEVTCASMCGCAGCSGWRGVCSDSRFCRYRSGSDCCRRGWDCIGCKCGCGGHACGCSGGGGSPEGCCDGHGCCCGAGGSGSSGWDGHDCGCCGQGCDVHGCSCCRGCCSGGGGSDCGCGCDGHGCWSAGGSCSGSGCDGHGCCNC
mmetsp:Transcript_32730/g.97408  ORF Transcript_32730/g.97408 Transcript_32730/m.97408 type:complete len:363 (+) Transcript_32730:281-1369(+)